MRKRAKKEEAQGGEEGADGFRISGRELVPPGEYTVTLKLGDQKWTRRAVIREMPVLE